MNRQQQLAIRALENLKGDDTYRAKLAFRGMTSEQMDQQHGESGKTRRQILAEYQEHDRNVEEAIAWVKMATLA